MTDPTADADKIDEAVLALLYLTCFNDGTRSQPIWRAWKGHDWDALDRLHQKGYISNPASKAKSVVFSDEGRREAERLFKKLFSP